jgi:hypothetical protein
VSNLDDELNAVTVILALLSIAAKTSATKNHLQKTKTTATKKNHQLLNRLIMIETLNKRY